MEKILLKERLYRWRPLLFFVGGFVFDLLTLRRVDNWITISLQLFYLHLLGFLLVSDFFKGFLEKKLKDKYLFFQKYKNSAIHFLFGALLSAYTIFYFKSSFGIKTFIFMVLLALVFVANESPKVKKSGLRVKLGIYALCLCSFLSYTIPVFTGVAGDGNFYLAVSFTGAVIGLIAFLLFLTQQSVKDIFKWVIAPSFTVLFVFSLLYFLELIPPVPISLQQIGIYHSVSKNTKDQYELTYYVEEKKHSIFRKDVFFVEDEIVCFARIFAPTQFYDKVQFRWLLWSHEAKKWLLQDIIVMSIVGGRERGFRGYSLKANYKPGKWRVIVETSNQREIGHIDFSIVPKPKNFNDANRVVEKI